jgi:hypothetical protein
MTPPGHAPDAGDTVDAWLRQMQAKHHQRHDALDGAIAKSAETQSQDARQPGAGGQPGHKRAAGPG